MQVAGTPGDAAQSSIAALRQQILVQTEIVTQAKQTLFHLQDSLLRAEQQVKEAQRQAEAIRRTEEAAEVIRKLPEKQLVYVKRCWQYLVKHRESRARRNRKRISMYSYDSYKGEWNPLEHPPEKVIRAAHRCHYMGLLRHKVGSYELIEYSYEDLERAYKSGTCTLGKLNFNNRDCGWRICTVSPAMATWPNEYDFSIDSGPKDHLDTFFAFTCNAGPSNCD